MSLKSDIRELKEKVARLDPGRSPGMLTSQTTRGVRRRPLRTASANASQSNRTTIPVWG